MSVETEAKYSLATDDRPTHEELSAAFHAVGYAVTQGFETVHVDRYFDDPRNSLGRAGLALRTRTSDGAVAATIKTLGSVDGAVHVRDEIELPVPPDASAWDPWPGPIADRIRMVTDPRSLRGRYELTTVRHVIAVLHDGQPVATVSFDDVTATTVGSDRSVRWNELEIEARSDLDEDRSREALATSAAAIERCLPLVPTSSTKLERARVTLSLGAALSD